MVCISLHAITSLSIFILLEEQKKKDKIKYQDVNGIYLLHALTSFILVLLDEQKKKDKEEDQDIDGMYFIACCSKFVNTHSTR